MSYPYPAVASSKFKSPPGAPPFSFNKGDRLTVLGQADDEGDWLEGETDGGGGKGVFPASFVERVEAQEEQRQEEEGTRAAEPVKQQGGEEGPLAAAIKQGVEQQEGDFPSVDTATAGTPAAAEKKDEDKSASVEAPPPPPPPTNPSSPPAFSSGADTITDEPRPTASSPPPPSSSDGGPPPAPAKKPSGLASRLAFFQQEAEKSKGPAPPPKPKPSGGGWKRPAPPAQPADAASSSSPAPAPAPSSATSPPPPMARTTSSSFDSTFAGGENAGFSAADAQESISRGGGSLRDRIAALSGGFKADQLQPSAAPGRAPKPWKKPQPTPAAEEEEDEVGEEKQEVKEEREQEGEVKDSRPAEEETTAQSPGAEVPPFEPAEAEPSKEEEGTRAPSHAEPAAEAIAAPLEDDNDEEGFAAPETKEEPRDAPDISTSRETVTDEPRPAASLPSTDEPSSSAPVAEGNEEDDEQARRSALAARMAGLGGQKIGGAVGGGGGMIMPALPKRAAGPRRGKSRPAAVAPPVEEKQVVEEEKPAENEDALEKKPDVLASMGGASSLLSKNDDDDDEEDGGRSKVPIDDDDFDSPAPPATSSASARPPPPQPQPQVYDDPPTAPGETVMDEEELAQRADAPSGGEGKMIAQEAVEALPAEDGVRELKVVPPETAQLEGANDLAEDGEEEAPLARAVAQELERTNEEFDEEENKPAPPPSRPPPPTRPVDPPAFSSGAETVTDEPRPTAEEPEQEEEEKEDDAPAPPPLPKGRPPIPPSFVRQPTATSDDDNNGEEDDERAPIRPPIPTHPPAINLPPVVTPAEAAFIASQPEILSPPEEAMDESTTGVELDAPSVATIAEGHEARDVELAEADKPHVRDSRKEGVATPAFEKSPPVFLPASAKPVGGASSVSGAAGGVAGKGESLGLAAVLAKKSLEEGKREEASRLVQPPAQQEEGEQGMEEEEEGGDGEEEEEEEEEEEDPEVARRRALAARMAKLGGRGMGPMFGAGFGGLPPAPPAKKKTIKKKKKTEGAGEGAPIEQKQPSEQVEEQVVESQSGSEPPSADGHPPRRIGGIPMGGFALPGIVPPRPREAEMEPEHEEQHVQPAADEDVPSTERGVSQDEYDEVKEQQQQQQGEEEEQAPPPLPPNRPSGGPPRRSVPVPAAEPEQGEQEEQYVDPAADEDYEQQQAQHASHLVDEPEEHDYPHQEEANEMPTPPPPPRPAGGHQSSVPQSPPLPSMSSIPAQSPARGAPPPPQLPEQNLTRSPTQSSRRSSTFLSGAAEKLGFGGSSWPAQSPRQSMDVDSRFDVERVQGGPLGGVASAPGGGAFAARDVDLDTAGMAWWREGGLPRSLQGKGDVLVDVSESTSTKRGTTRVEKEIEVIYNDLSKTLITASFISDDLAEATTSIQQSHFPPPAKANLDSLLQWSASLGAQVFAAAHGLKSSSTARGMSDAQLVEQCFAKATDPLLPVGGTYGVKVFEAVVEQGKKGALVAEDDEPRAGDIAVISAKFKHALTSKTVGSDQQPHLAIIVGYESKKGKLRVIEVNGKNGNVDEESYKVEDMKAGKVTVFRVAPRDYV